MSRLEHVIKPNESKKFCANDAQRLARPAEMDESTVRMTADLNLVMKRLKNEKTTAK